MREIIAGIAGKGRVNADISAAGSFSAAISPGNGRGAAPYTGPYTFTPSGQAQTIEIGGLIAQENIQIEAVPNNYGLITWDGSTLTVS